MPIVRTLIDAIADHECQADYECQMDLGTVYRYLLRYWSDKGHAVTELLVLLFGPKHETSPDSIEDAEEILGYYVSEDPMQRTGKLRFNVTTVQPVFEDWFRHTYENAATVEEIAEKHNLWLKLLYRLH